MASKPEPCLLVPRWQLEYWFDVLRMANNCYKFTKRDTCLHRDLSAM